MGKSGLDLLDGGEKSSCARPHSMKRERMPALVWFDGEVLTERLLLPQNSHDDTQLNGKVECRSDGRPNDSKDEQPRRVESCGVVGLEVGREGECRIEEDISRSDKENHQHR